MAQQLGRVGLVRLAARFSELKDALGESQGSGDTSTEAAVVARWADASIRVRLCLENGGA